MARVSTATWRGDTAPPIPLRHRCARGVGVRSPRRPPAGSAPGWGCGGRGSGAAPTAAPRRPTAVTSGRGSSQRDRSPPPSSGPAPSCPARSPGGAVTALCRPWRYRHPSANIVLVPPLPYFHHIPTATTSRVTPLVLVPPSPCQHCPSATTPVPPPPCCHHPNAITVPPLPPPHCYCPYHPSATISVPPPSCRHHPNATTPAPPSSNCHHPGATVPVPPPSHGHHSSASIIPRPPS